MKLKGKFYKSVVKLCFMNQYWAVDKKIEHWMSVANMRMLKWMSGVIREDRIRNKYVWKSIGVALITDKMRENRLRWFGYVIKREDLEVIKMVIELSFEGRIRGRSKKK